MTLVRRVFVVNAAIVTVAAVLLAVSPATVSFPIDATQATILAVGTAVLLLADFLLLRRAFGPFERLVAFMRTLDPERPGARAEVPRGSPDVTELHTSFNDVLDRLEAERQGRARRQAAAAEAERRRVARELHDEVGQLLTLALLHLDLAEGRSDRPADAALEEVRAAIAAALEETRTIARRLRPAALDDLGLAEALATVADSAARAPGLEVVRRIDPEVAGRLAPDEGLAVYRIAQEALTNVVRHAGARRVTVELGGEAGGVLLTVTDDGAGTRGAQEGEGLRGMRERAALVGGRLTVEAPPPGGCRVTLRLPPPAG